MLTPKQEKFVQNLIKGMSQREAYKNSYDAENMTDKSIDEEACRLFSDSKISSRYRELQDKLASEAIMTAQDRLKFLTDVIKGEEREHKVYIADGEAVEYDAEADLNAKLKAVDLMNKMQGEYTTNIKTTITYEDRLRELVGEDEY